MPLYRGTNERGALAVGVAGWDSLDDVESLLSWGPPPTAGLPRRTRFHAAWDHLPRPGHERADVILPGATFAEVEGSYTNLEGRVQFLRAPLPVEPPRRQGWEVLSELSVLLGLESEYVGIFEVQRAAAGAHAELAPLAAGAESRPDVSPVMIGAARP
jgi:NADH dehydrogenase/NADH:ubiquinone oxidoreductase subunit G